MDLLLPRVTHFAPMSRSQLAHPDDDAWLLAAFARGNSDAFDRLYERHNQPLHRFVRRLLGRRLADQVEEVFQDTWLTVIKEPTRYAPTTAAFRTWLLTVARNRALELLRRSGREVAMPDDDGPAPFQPPGEPWIDWPSPSTARQADTLFWRRAGERLLDCLEELPAAQRAVFLLHHDEEQTLAEIARAMELGFEAAKSRLRYAMSKLRVCMGAYLAPDVLGESR